LHKAILARNAILSSDSLIIRSIRYNRIHGNLNAGILILSANSGAGFQNIRD
jgi:hypothetical protein